MTNIAIFEENAEYQDKFGRIWVAQFKSTMSYGKEEKREFLVDKETGSEGLWSKGVGLIKLEK